MRLDSLRCLGPHGFHRIAYAEWGEVGNARVVLCVHGLTRSGRDFDQLAGTLERQRRVLCPDVVGRGRSDWLGHKQDYGYPLYLSDITSLIARSGADEVDWVGTSMGGLIGMMLAAQPNSPIRRLVINDVGPFIPKAAIERLASYVGKDPRFPGIEALEQYLRVVSASFGPLTDAQWRHLAVHSSRRCDDGSLRLAYDPAIGDAFAKPPQDISLWPVWDAISCRTLLLRGRESDLLLRETAEEMTRRGPRATLVEFAGVGHAPMLLAEDQIAVVREFLLGND
jgi:pimeloyl-ACP methyl ester carboxylesterase